MVLRPWTPLGVFRPWTPLGGFHPWTPLGVFRPWTPLGVFRPWTPLGVFPPWTPLGVFRIRIPDLPTPGKNPAGAHESYPARDLHLLGAAVKDFFKGQYELALDGWILSLGTTAVQSSEPRAHVFRCSLIELCTHVIT